MVEFKTAEDKKTMLGFLEKEYRPFSEVTQNKSLKENDLYPTSDLAYNGGYESSHLIGFNYGAGDDYFINYSYVLCYWMAINGGDKKDFGLLKDKPYIIYDGVEEWVLCKEEEKPKDIPFAVVDNNGFRINTEIKLMSSKKTSKLIFKNEIKKLEEQDKIINAELYRLTKAWNKQ